MKITINQNSSKSLSVLAIFAAVFLLSTTGIFAQVSMNRGGGGGGTVPTPTPTPVPVNPLPQTAPAPGVLYRESFGLADLARPSGGKGAMKSTYLHTNIKGFWMEYLGSKNTQWIGPDNGQTWNFCAASDNPYEMFSPIQVTYANGCVASDWFDNPTTSPTALMPVTLPNIPYEVSFNGYPAPLPGNYLALGLTNSPAVYSNLATVGGIVLITKPAPPYMNFTLLYELRVGGLNGTLLASGETFFDGWNQLKLRIDPVANTVGGSINGIDLGTHPLDIGVPRYAGFEGVGIGDNFMIRLAQ